MKNLFQSLVNCFSFAEYPAGDWHHAFGTAGLFATLALFIIGIVVIIAYIMQTISIAKWNLGICPELPAILHAIGGVIYSQILCEHVIEVKKPDELGQYELVSSDREKTKCYKVIPMDSDPDGEEYREAKMLAGDNIELFEALKPRGRVIKRMTLESAEEDTEILLVYLKTSNTKEVEEVVNVFFRREYCQRMREARADTRRNPQIAYFGTTI